LERLFDENKKVVILILEREGLLDYIEDKQTLLEAMKTLLHQEKTPKQVSRKIIEFLCGPFLDSDPAYSNQILQAILPFLWINFEANFFILSFRCFQKLNFKKKKKIIIIK